MDLIGSVFNFFTDRTKKFSHKTVLVLSIIVALIILDNTLNFTTYFSTINKLETVEKINNIILDSTLSKEERTYLKKLRKKVIFHNTWKDKIYNKLISIDLEKNNENIDEQSNKQIQKAERNYWIHFITSSWIIILIMVMIPFMIFFDKTNTSLPAIIAAIIISEPILFGVSWIFAKLFSLIPVISNNPIFNYIINATLHLIIILAIGFISNKKKKSKRKFSNNL